MSVHAFAAAGWGLVGGMALVIGAAIAYRWQVPQRVIAGVMAFGAGVLISALSFELMEKAFARGGFISTASGFLAGGAAFTAANLWLDRHGAKHRKRSGAQQKNAREHPGSGAALAIAALLDGVPESIAIGVSMLEGGAVSIVTVLAIFLSNLPEGLSSAAGMKRAGRSARFIFGVWGGIALASGLSAFLGYAAFADVSPAAKAMTLAIAAGAILAMLADTMIPEAFETAHDFSGLITVLGFLSAFFLSHVVE